MKVIIVHLRRPRLNDSADSRTDPFWEFGSFGLTGCHCRNLMCLRRVGELRGARLAFVQGGSGIMKLVYLSPPVETFLHKNIAEVRWEPSMPFCFMHAPLVVNGFGKTMFPKLRQTFAKVNRDTWPQKFSSAYRSRTTFLPDNAAKEVVEIFDAVYVASDQSLASTYEQSLPFLPSVVDENRSATYELLFRKARS